MAEAPPRGDDAIAVVGIGCKVPGADNIREFWRVLLQGENHIVEIPPSRWNADAFYDADPMAPGKTYVKRAGLVKGFDEFDNKLFGINDFEAAQMDPQQRFVLDCTQMALEDAGITKARIAGSKTGVFLGAMNSDYRGLFSANTSNVGNYTVTGISNSIIAARVSYVFDLRGPSLVLDTACSSSLIGIHLGSQAIRAGDCDMAICGGTNYLTVPDVFVHLSKAGMISPTGQCHSFSNKADGYTRGEGCGIVILKRLRDAERDGDNIWATIHTGSNQDGHSVAPITAPSGQQQACLLDDVFHRIGLDPSRIDYIEAHGTGTNAGDPVEANTLGQFFKTRASPRQRYVGSVKTNIGHLESAAGVVGVIKVLLMMKNSKIVPSLHCEVANPKINFPELMLTVPGKPVDWENPDKVSCCNSFGFGGSNSHAVLCHYSRKDSASREIATTSKTRRPCLVCFSACTERSLRAMMEDVYSDPTLTELNVHDLARTSTARRDHYPVRVALIVEDMADLVTALEEEIARPSFPAGVHRKPRVSFVFCGMGTAWGGMCKELMDVMPVFREAIMQVEEELKTYVDWSLSARLQNESHFDDHVFCPIAIFACQVALTAMWRDLGLEPQSIVGQSVGEVAAAHAAGCLSLADAVKIVYHRSHLLATVAGGKMTIVRNASVEKVRQVVDRYQGKASISLQYSPNACCVSADSDVMPQIRTDLLSSLRPEHRGVQLVDLDVPVAYHSHHVDPCKAPLAQALQGLEARPPTVPLVSSVTGERITEAPGVDYWVDNLRQPVMFGKAVKSARDPKHTPLFLEIGPRPVLKAHLDDIFPKEEMPCVSSMSRPPEFKSLLQSLAALYGHGASIAWSRLPTLSTRLTDMPRYVFDKKKNLSKTESGVFTLSGVDERLRNHPYVYPLQNSQGFRLIVTPLGFKSIYDHVIAGRIVIPGAFYAEAGFAVARHFNTCSGRRALAVSVDFEQALSVGKDDITEIEVCFAQDANPAHPWLSPIRVVKDSRLLALIRISEIQSDSAPTEVVNLDSLRARCPNEVTKDTIYSALRSAGFFYGETFCLLESARTNADECVAMLRVNKSVMDELPGTTIHPSILDCMLQSSLIITTTSSRSKQRDLLPKALGRVMVHRPLEPLMAVHTRLKVQGSKQNFYDLKLLSTSGNVIAELEGLVINLIMEVQDNAIPDMFSNEWTPVVPLTPPPPSSLPPTPTTTTTTISLTSPDIDPKSTEAEEEVLYLCDRRDVLKGEGAERLVAEGRAVVMEGMDFTGGLPQKVHQMILGHRKASAVVLLLETQPLSDGVDGDTLDRVILNWSFLYKELMVLLNRLSLTLPVYLCTCNAWPSLLPRPHVTPNPVATSLWGLCRTVLRERIYPSIVSVELQLPPEHLTLPFLTSLVHVLLTDNKLQEQPELLVTPEDVYINLITVVDPDTPVPMFRSNAVSREQSAILLSSEASALVKPVAILHDATSVSGKEEKDMTHISVQSYALQNSSLLKMKMQYERLDRRANATKASGYTVFAVEAVGTAAPSPALGPSNSNNPSSPCVRVVTCYPSPMATQVLVPSSTTLRTDLLPGYQVGDLAKLVLLFELLKKVETARLTVLTSNRTGPYAAILQTLFAGRKVGKVPCVLNIVNAEQLWKAKQQSTNGMTVHETVISLVRLDGHTATSLTSRWNNATALVSLSSLVDSEALSCVYCFSPSLDVVLLDTQLLFQPAALKKSVPEVARWLKRQGTAGGQGAGVVPKVMSSLHAPDSMALSAVSSGDGQGQTQSGGEVILDLADLLRFQKSDMKHLEVQVNKDELFRKDSVYIVVGGLSGLGWICVDYMVEKGAGYVAIFNRRAPSQEQRSNMAGLSSRHRCHVNAFQCDVTSRQSLQDAFQQMQATFPGAKLKGIFFGAAVTDDKSFLGMDVASFDKALSPKVRGAWNLHQLTKNQDLDYFVLHSSVASVVGNSGQTNYATGNAFMDGLAHFRRREGLAAQAINWGALDIGILGSNDTAKQILESQGFLFMSTEQIREALTPILMLNWPQCSPIRFDRERLTQKFNRESIVPLKNRLKNLLLDSSTKAEIEPDLLHEVQAAKTHAEAEKRLSIYENYVRKLAARVLSVDASGVTPEVSLLDLGMDSIVAMTMINQIHRDTARRLPAVVFITGDPTVTAIAEAIDEAPEDGADGDEEDTTGGPKIVEVDGEDALDVSVEASPLEVQELTMYQQHPRRHSLHGTVDLPLEKYQADKERVGKAIVAVLAKHPSARAVFSEDNKPRLSSTSSSTSSSSGRRVRRSTLTTEKCFDLRVICEGEVLGESLDSHSAEDFDVQRSGPVRFVLVNTPKPMLRVVYHKVAFDLTSAAVLVTDLTRCLEASSDSSESSALVVAAQEKNPELEAMNSLESNKLNERLEKLYRDHKTDIEQFWQPKLNDCYASSIRPGSLKFACSDNGHGVSEIGSVKVLVPPSVLLRLRDFVQRHEVTLLGVVGSCYQVLLHTLTGEDSIPLVFPVDLRKMGLVDVSSSSPSHTDNLVANCCNDIPFVAHFSPGEGRSLKSFVLDNDSSMMGAVTHGVLPLAMFDSLATPLQSLFSACQHGISIDNVRLSDTSNGLSLNGKTAGGSGSASGSGYGPTKPSHASSSSSSTASKSKFKAKHALKLRVTEGRAVMPRDLETNLMVEHEIRQGVMSLTLSYKRSVLDRVQAESVLRALVMVVSRLLTHPDTSVSKMVRRGRKFKRKLAKQCRKSGGGRGTAPVTSW